MTALTLHDVAVSTMHFGIEGEHCRHRIPLAQEIARVRAGFMRKH